MQVSACTFEKLRDYATGCCDGPSPDALRAALLGPATAPEETTLTATAATRIALAYHSGVRDGCVAGAQGDRTAQVILRLPDDVQNRSARCLSSADSAEQSSRQRGVEPVQALTYLGDFRIAPNRSSESYSGTTTPLQMSSIQARRRRLGREAFDFEALIGIWRGLATVQRCPHWRQAQTDTRTPRSRRISSRPIQTLEAAHSGQEDFMANVGVYRYGALLRYRAICNGVRPI